MNIPISQSMLVSRAVAYIQEKIADTGKACNQTLLDEAAMRFNLSPVEARALERIFRDQKKD